MPTSAVEVARDVALIDAYTHLNDNGRRRLTGLLGRSPVPPFADVPDEAAWWLLNNRWPCGHPVFWTSPDAAGCACVDRPW